MLGDGGWGNKKPESLWGKPVDSYGSTSPTSAPSSTPSDNWAYKTSSNSSSWNYSTGDSSSSSWTYGQTNNSPSWAYSTGDKSSSSWAYGQVNNSPNGQYGSLQHSLDSGFHSSGPGYGLGRTWHCNQSAIFEHDNKKSDCSWGSNALADLENRHRRDGFARNQEANSVFGNVWGHGAVKSHSSTGNLYAKVDSSPKSSWLQQPLSKGNKGWGGGWGGGNGGFGFG